MERPRKCIHPNCERCVLPDCIYDNVERKDVFEQDMFDKDLKVVEPEVLSRRERQSRYNHSEKGKASRKRYSMTEKGRENDKKKRQRKIDNGRNAEYCRRYYYKKKARNVILTKASEVACEF